MLTEDRLREIEALCEAATPGPEERAALVAQAYGHGKRRSKYGAERCTIHEPAHASLKECRRYGELAVLERLGAIRNLRQQVRHILLPAVDGERAVHYVSDFEYDEHNPEWADQWRHVIEDSKGYRTPVYRLKRRLMMFHRDFLGGCPGCPPGAVGASYIRET